MQAPYFIVSGLFLGLTAIVTLDSSLANLGWMPAFGGVKWLRVHFITLGVLTESILGLLPVLTARGLKLPKPKVNWTVWLAYNTGLILLLIGLPIVDRWLIITGGTLIFAAVLVVMKDLIDMRKQAIAQEGKGVCTTYATTRFYLGGLFYLLIGVLVGTGMWIGWSEPLHIAIPKEVHVHSNLWGYTAIVFSGFLFELFPQLRQKKILGKSMEMIVFLLMFIGASGLVIGPWLDIGWPAVVGLTMHTVGVVVLLGYLIAILVKNKELRHPGYAQIVSSYVWLLVPVIVAPYIVAKASESFPVEEVAGGGGPILIYGWIMTFLSAVIPHYFPKFGGVRSAGTMGGSWASLAFMHLGGVLFWVALFFPPAQKMLRAGAFFFWLLGMLPLLMSSFGWIRSNANDTLLADSAASD